MKKKTRIILAILAGALSLAIMMTTALTATGLVLLCTPVGKFIATATRNTAVTLFTERQTYQNSESSEDAVAHPWCPDYMFSQNMKST